MGAHLVLIAPGSRGHVDPCVGLGVRLRDAGHRVTLAVDRAFTDLVTSAGLGLRVLPGDFRSCVRESPRRHEPAERVISSGRIAAARLLRAYLAEVNVGVPEAMVDADAVLVGELGIAGYHVAEARGIPSLGLHVAPMHIGGALSAERLYFKGVNDLRHRYGLPATTPEDTARRQRELRWPIHFGLSPSVVARPGSWPEWFTMAGFWWPHLDPGWRPPAELTEFLAAGPPPVFVGFGSMMPGDADRLAAVVSQALRAAGVRGVVQSGWADLTVHGPDVLTIADVPYEWLFPRTAAVVHAAGAGVTAAGLRAGVPAVPLPYTSPDQPFWADRLVDLGVAPTGALRLRTVSGAELGAAIRGAVADVGLRARAERLAAAIRAEDGMTPVLDAVARIVS
ncbi:glycosyltransferase [Kutzneria buriramensis]|uniref:UDP:flavonoid glycosyltransferase YjiC (YdhE family) n=1 Tax=Kutzneria buriramensis TaxID=1045776 RepID=A0A3E0GZS7_9PSEU|nr:glycosyltransferase [Kutzneria buriramensis]REH35677.1 UDP:flavonoid glycosyltransferase YjiC (YdhE family) [Kutzneria buriramensis]